MKLPIALDHGRTWTCRPGTRNYEWVVVGLPYVIVYEVDKTADEVAIIAVFHGAQDRDLEGK